MIKRIFLYTLISACSLLPLNKAKADGIGTWKNYMAYSNTTWVEQVGKKLYVLASDNLYVYNEADNSIQTYDKTRGLNSADIDFIAWNNTAKLLVIVYADFNIDLLSEKGEITNLSSYKNKLMTDMKTINDLYMYNGYCYISTGFGVLKINCVKAEVSDTYKLGFNVNHTFIEGNSIYASSESAGLYKATLTDNLLDKNNWQRVGEYRPNNKYPNAELMAKANTLLPGGPKYNRFFFMRYLNNRLYSTGGAFESGSVGLNHIGAVQVLNNNGEWSIYEDDLKDKTGYKYIDMNCLAVDPKNPEHVFVGGRSGLYEFMNGRFKTNYNKHNTPLRGAIDRGKELGKDYVVINGLAFDKAGSLWVLNCQTKETSLLELKPDGKMVSHHKPDLMEQGTSLRVMRNAMFDSRGLLWFTNHTYIKPGIFCYQPSTDALNSYTRFINQDGIPVGVAAVSCAVEDMYKNIWVGTNVGPLLLKADQISNPEQAVFEQVKVPRNDGTNLADYLLAGIDITSMAIDDAGRKWFGTASTGVYLISEDNMTQVQHFTAENSPLLSNVIESIAINNATGEVFFGTDKGLCSYISDATTPMESPSSETTYAYPNPVRPEYRGPIAVVGLYTNSDVKIVTTNGVLVAQGTSNGGTFVWDGNDMNGNRVASGVYIVQAADQQGSNETVCKIAIVN